MKQLNFLVLLFACASCSKTVQTEVDYKFSANAAISLSQSGLLESKKVIDLSFSDSSLITSGAVVEAGNSEYYIYMKGKPYPVLAFDKSGNFKNRIGNIGSGRGEYPVINDVRFNALKNTVEILANTSILRYTPENVFIESKPMTTPAFSFAIDDKGYYWFYVSNTDANNRYKMIRMDENLGNAQKFMYQESDLPPIYESNFKRGTYLTFNESLSHELYTLKDGNLERSHVLGFQGYEFPADLYEKDAMEAIKLLRDIDHVVIRAYQETDQYVFVYLLMNKAQLSEAEFTLPKVYYWMIDKRRNRQKVIELSTELGGDSYLFNPQFMASDSTLCCLGYLLEDEGDAERFTDTDSNPSLVFLNLNKIFDD